MSGVRSINYVRLNMLLTGRKLNSLQYRWREYFLFRFEKALDGSLGDLGSIFSIHVVIIRLENLSLYRRYLLGLLCLALRCQTYEKVHGVSESYYLIDDPISRSSFFIV